MACKLLKNEHITTVFRSFKTFNEYHHCLRDIAADLEPVCNISLDSDINDDCKFSLFDVRHQLDRHAPVKLEELNHAVSPNGLLKLYLKPEN